MFFQSEGSVFSDDSLTRTRQSSGNSCSKIHSCCRTQSGSSSLDFCGDGPIGASLELIKPEEEMNRSHDGNLGSNDMLRDFIAWAVGTACR
ncbi:hypothetical protein DBV23_12465 [Edwardsiella ictaluri]|uniref:Uncharacterized protein n=2 Tax=Edwardsiella ictaluri TaxID=67780 RepID=C5B8T7_EDWI9|nr:hypothetical protein [Edwardsiella ictaluri]ACR70140.1 hypothetical protein NT01EI_2986 [Edwardsiella ictaluri 93-146]AVZ82967.1 hypothetical protein DBV23_12465 [Edwardsiella ictaluri]EKS7763988.1 hypothetical protein [Edwardsiella ictaluri]EKS7770768.1 hypothetical protein [Edwardsiella ictaluri]EKS7773912.1 hypothetical protein [Edwardsiella ictaluri]